MKYSEILAKVRKMRSSEWLCKLGLINKEKCYRRYTKNLNSLLSELTRRSDRLSLKRQKEEREHCISMCILTTGATMYIAKCIASVLKLFNIKVKILNKFNAADSADDERLYFVLTPMEFKNGLPRNYVAIQMEQTISDRWFNDDYISKLNRAKCVLDYSLLNLKFLRSRNIATGKVFYLPISPMASPIDLLKERSTDVLFYGDDRCERRKKALDYIGLRHKLKRAFCVYNDKMTAELDKAKIVINIHYYEGAMLETTRICEAISRGCLVISEVSCNDSEYPELAELVDFVPLDDVEAMSQRIEYWLSNPLLMQERVRKNSAAINALYKKFCYNLGRVLFYLGYVGFDALYHVCHDAYNFGNYALIYSPENACSEKTDLFSAVFEKIPTLPHKNLVVEKYAILSFLARRTLDTSSRSLAVCRDTLVPSESFLTQLKDEQCRLEQDKLDVLSSSDKGDEFEFGINSSLSILSSSALRVLASNVDVDTLIVSNNDSKFTWGTNIRTADLNLALDTSEPAVPAIWSTVHPDIYAPFDVNISVIIPCYNQSEFLSECIDSVLAQTYRHYEIVIIDDGSTDNSYEIAMKYQGLYPERIRCIRQKNMGVVESRNNAIKQARGKYIYPLDGDDKIAPTCLEKLYEAMICGKGDVIYSQTDFFGVINGPFNLPLPSRARIIGGNCIVCSALYRKSDWAKFGGYDQNCALGYEDWAFWLAFMNVNKKFYRLEETLFYYRRKNCSRDIKAQKELKKISQYLRKKYWKLTLYYEISNWWRKNNFYSTKVTSKGRKIHRIMNVPIFWQRKNSNRCK